MQPGRSGSLHVNGSSSAFEPQARAGWYLYICNGAGRDAI